MGKYTKEQRQFIIDNVKGTNYRVLAEMFNKEFGENKTRQQIKGYCNRHDLRNGVDSKATIFKKGHDPYTIVKPLYSEKKTGNGEVLIKVREDAKIGNYLENWELKKVVVWEQHYGKKPKDLMVLQLNGDKNDCNIDNLILVEVHETMLLYKLDYVFNDPQLTLSALYYIRLGRQRRKREKEMKEWIMS